MVVASPCVASMDPCSAFGTTSKLLLLLLPTTTTLLQIIIIIILTACDSGGMSLTRIPMSRIRCKTVPDHNGNEVSPPRPVDPFDPSPLHRTRICWPWSMIRAVFPLRIQRQRPIPHWPCTMIMVNPSGRYQCPRSDPGCFCVTPPVPRGIHGPPRGPCSPWDVPMPPFISWRGMTRHNNCHCCRRHGRYRR